MTQEDQKYYDEYFELFTQNGWKQFITEITDILNGHRIEDVKTTEDLFYLQGQRSILHRLNNFATEIETSYEDLTEHANVA